MQLVAMLEVQHQRATGIVIDQGGAGAREQGWLGKACGAKLYPVAGQLIGKGKWQAATIAQRWGDKTLFVPAVGTKAAIGRHQITAKQAARRQDKVGKTLRQVDNVPRHCGFL